MPGRFHFSRWQLQLGTWANPTHLSDPIICICYWRYLPFLKEILKCRVNKFLMVQGALKGGENRWETLSQFESYGGGLYWLCLQLISKCSKRRSRPAFRNFKKLCISYICIFQMVCIQYIGFASSWSLSVQRENSGQLSKLEIRRDLDRHRHSGDCHQRQLCTT